jgi:hypothetical protein
MTIDNVQRHNNCNTQLSIYEQYRQNFAYPSNRIVVRCVDASVQARGGHSDICMGNVFVSMYRDSLSILIVYGKCI